jgi:maltooligosyltrehalose trehalohydrolase
LKQLKRQNLEVTTVETDKLISLRRWSQHSQVFSVFNFGKQKVTWRAEIPKANWQKQLDSAEPQWLGNGSNLPPRLTTPEPDLTIPAQSFVLYEMK